MTSRNIPNIRIIDPSRSASETKTYLIEYDNNVSKTLTIKLSHNLCNINNINLNINFINTANNRGKKSVTSTLSKDNFIKKVNDCPEITRKRILAELSSITEEDIRTRTQKWVNQIPENTLDSDSTAIDSSFYEKKFEKAISQHDEIGEHISVDGTESFTMSDNPTHQLKRVNQETQTQIPQNNETAQLALAEQSDRITIEQLRQINDILEQRLTELKAMKQNHQKVLEQAQTELITQKQVYQEALEKLQAQLKESIAQKHTDQTAHEQRQAEWSTQKQELQANLHRTEAQQQQTNNTLLQKKAELIAQNLKGTQTELDKADNDFSSNKKGDITVNNNSINQKALKSNDSNVPRSFYNPSELLSQLQDPNISPNKFIYIYSNLNDSLIRLDLSKINAKKLTYEEKLHDYVLVQELTKLCELAVKLRSSSSFENSLDHQLLYEMMFEFHNIDHVIFNTDNFEKVKSNLLKIKNKFIESSKKSNRSIPSKYSTVLHENNTKTNEIKANLSTIIDNEQYQTLTLYEDFMDLNNYINQINLPARELTEEEKIEDLTNIIQLVKEQIERYDEQGIKCSQNSREQVIEMLATSINNAHVKGIIITKLKQKTESNIPQLDTIETVPVSISKPPKIVLVQETALSDEIKPSSTNTKKTLSSIKKSIKKRKLINIELNEDELDEFTKYNDRQSHNGIRRINRMEYSALKKIQKSSKLELSSKEENELFKKINGLDNLPSINNDEIKILKQIMLSIFYQNIKTTKLQQQPLISALSEKSSPRKKKRDDEDKEEKSKK